MRTRPSPGAGAAAQLRLLLALVAGLDPPLVGTARRAVLGEPRVDDAALGGVPATVFRPARGAGPWPALVVFSGATRRGRGHPAFQGLGRALAATGHLVAVAEPDGVSAGELQPRTLEDALAAARALAASREARSGRIGVAGVSVGAVLALLVAADVELADRVSVAVALAPCCDVALAIRVVTTDTYASPGGLVPFVPGSFSRLVMARSLVASLPASGDRDALRRLLLALPDDAPNPLATLRTHAGDELGEPAEAAVALLANEDPARFDDLFATLPASLREVIAHISPISRASDIRAPVEVVVGRADKYLPLADALAFAARCPTARLTVLDSLAHAVPRASVREARDVLLLDRALVRSLAAARTRA
jgi:acetyl esterase/lipase